jgi:polyhydroxyalkanoate synthase
VEQLEDIDGLGSTYADRLRDAGIVSPTHLVEANLETIVEAADVREDQAEQWIESARAA